MQNKRNSGDAVIDTRMADTNWRSILQHILAEKDIQELLDKQGINKLTLSRWANNQTTPQKGTLTMVLGKLHSRHREQLLPALLEAGLLTSVDSAKFAQGEPLPMDTIPASFYREILDMVKTTSASLLLWSISRPVLRQCVAQLNGSGELLIMLLTCTPPAKTQPVQSLRELAYMAMDSTGREEFQPSTRFLQGSESLPGQVSTMFQDLSWEIVPEQSLQFQPLFPSGRVVKSAFAVPLLRVGKFGGCVWFLSTQEDFFTEQRKRVARDYTALMTLGFEDHAFYERGQINLAPMPPIHLQKISFNKRVWTVAFMKERASSNQEQTEMALQLLEQELIKLAQQTQENTMV